MKHKIILMCGATLGSLALGSAAFASQAGFGSASLTKGDAESFKMEFSSAKNKFYIGDGVASDGQAELKTNLGNAIIFNHSKGKASTGWQSFEKDGYFYNVDAINGMKSIKVSFASSGSSFKVFYSGDAKLDRSEAFTASKDQATSFDFDGRTANYFKILNTGDSNLDIASIEIEYSCLSSYLTLSVSSEDETKGTVNGGGAMIAGDVTTLIATPASGCTFDGWYSGDSLISKESNYSFTMPESDTDIVAKFLSQDDINKKLGITPVFSEDKKTVTYGLYPQTHVKDEGTIEALGALTETASNGWYLYNGDYYAKKTATINFSGRTFSDGTSIVKGTDYWFKCEPILWTVLSSSEGSYSLLSASILDMHVFDGFPNKSNNYETSIIRTWLNGSGNDSFLGSAFALGDALIQTATVDNSASTTYSSSNQYFCGNTEDKVYLLSYQDYLNEEYGFVTNTSKASQRKCAMTDYVRAMMLGDDGYGYYLTRSPYSMSGYVSYVDSTGKIDVASYYDDTRSGVRPAMTIKIA